MEENIPIEIYVDYGSDQIIEITQINLITDKEITKRYRHNQIPIITQGSIYKIPIDKHIDSDSYMFMKVFSNISKDIDVRSIKDGFAYIVPIKNKVSLIDKTLLCLVWNNVQSS